MATWLRVGAALAAAAALAIVVWQMRGASGKSQPRPVRFLVPPPEGGEFNYLVEGDFLAISPDGTQIAYVAWGAKDVMNRVWVRPLSAFAARPIAGTEGVNSILWSPDGRSIAFFTRDKLKRVEVAGGAPVPICDIPAGGGKAGTWGRSDILFAAPRAPRSTAFPLPAGSPPSSSRPIPSRSRREWPGPGFFPMANGSSTFPASSTARET